MKSQKLKFVTALQGFGIILVVLGHSGPDVIFPALYGSIHKYIYSFHMPLFMALSGYLFAFYGGIRDKYSNFIRKKASRLLFPYFVISSLAFVPKVLLVKHAMRPVDLSFLSYINNFIYPWDNVIIFFWFLPTLFIIFCLSPIFDGTNSLFKMLIVTISLVALNTWNPLEKVEFLNLSGVCLYLIYFWIGCLIARNWTYLQPLLKKKVVFAFLLFLTVLLNQINFHVNILIASAGIFMSFSLCQQKFLQNSKLLETIGLYSYQIYLLSWFPQVFFKIIGFQVLSLNFYAVGCFMFLGGLTIPMIISKIFQAKNYRTAIGL